MKHKSQTIEIYTINPEDLVLHPEALATPKMTSENYEALKQDIEMNGQIDPVSVYRGKIVDGRHRWLILQELGVDTIKYTKLPNNTTLEEIKQLVHSKEMRRHESAGQLAIRAYRLKVAPNSVYSSFVAAANAVGANRKRVSEVKKIIEVYNRPDIIDWLFEGNAFNTGTEYAPFWTDSLGTILNWLAEHGTISGAQKKPEGIQPREELTEDEQLLVNTYVKAMVKESDLVLKEIAKQLYGRVMLPDNVMG